MTDSVSEIIVRLRSAAMFVNVSASRPMEIEFTPVDGPGGGFVELPDAEAAVHAAADLASPDERLREAGEALAASIRELGRPIGDTTGGRWGRAKKALDAWVAALAAADREAPDGER